MEREERERLEKEALEKQKKEDEENKKKAEKRQELVNSFDVEMPDDLPDTSDIKELAKVVIPEIFKTYYSIMKNPLAPTATRKACADALLDRAVGKAEQAITQKVEIKRDDVSMEEVARRMLLISRQAKEEGLISSDVIDVEPEKEDTEDDDEATSN